MHILLYKTAKFYVLTQSRSILLVPPKYTLENLKIWSFFNVFDDVITQSRGISFALLETTNCILGLGKVSFHLVECFRI